eukprot:109679_1
MKSGCCTICLEPLFKDIQVSSQCGHVFHRSCIYRWIDSANTCPNCKQHCDASQLTNLFLDPIEIIKEVLTDPTVLQTVDPELLLQMYRTDSTNGNDFRMELIEERIKNSELSLKHKELSTKLSAVTVDLRDAQHEQTKLHRKMQSYLTSAQSYERKFVDQEDQVKKLNIELFKKNKEIIRYVCMIGNMNAVHEIEMKVSESGKSKKEQAVYWKSMYSSVLEEHEREKKSHQSHQKILEEQRLQIKTLERCGIENLEKINKYKKVYFKLKNKYTKQRLQLQVLYKQKKNRETALLNEATDHGQQEVEVLSISNDVNQVNEKEDEDDDLRRAAMFSTYHEMQSKKDGRNRKRNFSQLTKGDDGCEGVQPYLTDGSSNHNRKKRRRCNRSIALLGC